MKKSYINYVLIVALFSIFSTASGQEEASKLKFRTSLSGAQEVTDPAGGVTTETGGSVRVVFDKELSKATIQVVVREGVGITAAHLHCAPAGVNGAIVVPLFNNPAGQDVDGELDLGEQAIVENADITPPPEGDTACGVPLNNIASLAFAILTGRVYANVHSVANPDGVVRGQLLPILVPAPSQ
jgi:CHRD domain